MHSTVIVLGVLAVATVFGLWRRRTDGRVRLQFAQSSSGDAAPFAAFGPMGAHATIVQFSSAVCAPCRAAKTISREIASTVPGVTHVEIDAEAHLDLVKEYGVMRTPTLLVLDGNGRLSARISGVPRKDELLIALDDRRFENI